MGREGSQPEKGTSLVEFLSHNTPWLSAGGLLIFLSSFGQTFFISIFAGEIRAEFGLSHGTWGGIYSLGTTASAVVMIWAGALTDVFRVRVLGPVVLAGLAVACIAMALTPFVWFLPIVVFCGVSAAPVRAGHEQPYRRGGHGPVVCRHAGARPVHCIAGFCAGRGSPADHLCCAFGGGGLAVSVGSRRRYRVGRDSGSGPFAAAGTNAAKHGEKP